MKNAKNCMKKAYVCNIGSSVRDIESIWIAGISTSIQF